VTAAVVTLVGTPDPTDREVTWRELAALVDATGLTPSYADGAGRAYVLLDDTLVWASCRGVVLDPWVPGAAAIAEARVRAQMAAVADEDRARLAGLQVEARDRELAARRALRDLPDPAQWQIDAYCDREGRGEFS
jgi:hypothetical protein